LLGNPILWVALLWQSHKSIKQPILLTPALLGLEGPKL
jgi:hypothetical protein